MDTKSTLVGQWLAVAIVLVGSPALGQPRPVAGVDQSVVGDEQIERWIAELGHDEFAVRQSAMHQLQAAGYAAREALLPVAEGPDPEVRAAARRLITLIEKSEFSRRLEEFAADVDGRLGVTLPGWQEFGDLVGRDEAARALFVEMQREEAPLIKQAFEDPNGIRQIPWEDRISRLQQFSKMAGARGLAPPLGSCLTLFFLGSLEGAYPADNVQVQLVQLAQRSPMNQVLPPQHGQHAARRVMSNWLVRCPSQREDVLALKVWLIINYELPDALPLARDILRSDALMIRPPGLRVLAIQSVGRFGSAEDVEILEPLLEDRADVTPHPRPNPANGDKYSVQMRDLALATMLHLTDQNLKDYGFMRVRRLPATVFDPNSVGMESDERREAAAAQWHEWRAKHPLTDDAPR